MEHSENSKELSVWGIVESNKPSNAYALVLGEKGGTRHLPVIVGKSEAQNILIAQKHIFMPRPLTHDLFLKVLVAVGWSLEYVEIYKENDGVFYAYLALRQSPGLCSYVNQAPFKSKAARRGGFGVLCVYSAL